MLSYAARVYFRKLDKGGESHIREILGGNMKTRLAVYKDGLFDLRGGKTFLRRGEYPPPPPP